VTQRELELVIAALNEQRQGLEGYLRWVDDRPMLPSTEIAIARIKAECRELITLQVKLIKEKQT
jgi:hypothetical protein